MCPDLPALRASPVRAAVRARQLVAASHSGLQHNEQAALAGRPARAGVGASPGAAAGSFKPIAEANQLPADHMGPTQQCGALTGHYAAHADLP